MLSDAAGLGVNEGVVVVTVGVANRGVGVLVHVGTGDDSHHA